MPWGKSPRYQLDMRLDGLQSRSERDGEVKKKNPITLPTGKWTPAAQPVAQTLWRYSKCSGKESETEFSNK
jgi:hypothetical protein